MKRFVALLPLLLILSACGSPPLVEDIEEGTVQGRTTEDAGGSGADNPY
tara:strand:+ start:669 stop:815 length:147 start_codon:yes stop_codon:yes gene_type:complete